MELPLLLVSSLGGVATEYSLVTATALPPPHAIYHLICLFLRILMRPLWTLVDACLVGYPSFPSSESYSDAPATSHILFDSYRLPDSDETLVDFFQPLVAESLLLLVSSTHGVATPCYLVTASEGPQPRVLYHSICLVCRTLMRPLRT